MTSLDVDRSSVIFDHLSGDVEAKTGTTFTFGAEKRFKKPAHACGINTRARIGNRDPQLGSLPAGSNRKYAAIGFGHGVHRILQKVDDRLSDLPAIDLHDGQVRLDMRLNVDRLRTH